VEAHSDTSTSIEFKSVVGIYATKTTETRIVMVTSNHNATTDLEGLGSIEIFNITILFNLQVLAIEFVTFAIEFVTLAIEFVPLAIEFVALARKFVITELTG